MIIIINVLLFVIIRHGAFLRLFFLNSVDIWKLRSVRWTTRDNVEHIVWIAIWRKNLVTLVERGCEIGLLLPILIIVVHCLAIMLWTSGQRGRVTLRRHHFLIITIQVNVRSMSTIVNYNSLWAFLAPSCIHNQPSLSIWCQLIEILNTMRLSRKTDPTICFAVWLLTVASSWYALSLSTVSTCSSADIGGSGLLALHIFCTSSNRLGVHGDIFLRLQLLLCLHIWFLTN